jgi:hypothetical protein
MPDDLVALELPAEAAALPVVRMVVGGMAARVDLSLDELDDLYLAVEQVLGAVPRSGERGRYSIRISTLDGVLRIEIGPYERAGLEHALEQPCCKLVARVAAIDVLDRQGEQACVLITKRGSAHSS